MNIVDKNKKWVSNMILILFCAVMIKFSRFFNDEIIVYDIIIFFAFLIHFVTLKSFLKQFSKIYIVARKLFFLCYVIILFFRSQIFTYVCHSLKIRYACSKRRIFLIILMHSRNHLNFARSWDLIQNVNRFIIFSRIYKNFII